MAHKIVSKVVKVFKAASPELYSPLNTDTHTFRLLHLLPGAWEDDISAELHECSMIQCRDRYITISYTWGQPNEVPRVPITCNGKAVLIYENLCAALRRLRRSNHVLLIWVDALCINQDDTLERTQQVGLMGDIYSNSQETIIWLGEPANNEHEGRGFAKAHANHSRIIWNGDERDKSLRDEYFADIERFHLFGIPAVDQPWTEAGPDIFGAFCLIHSFAEDASRPALNILDKEKVAAMRRYGFGSIWQGLVLAKACVRGSRSSRVWEGLARLMSRPWWQRVWIVQETVLSRRATIHYGMLSAPWSMFTRAASNYKQQRHTLCLDLAGTLQGQDILDQFSDLVLRIEDTRLQNSISSDTATMLSLLWKFRPLEATDKRDKIFALLGLTTNWQGLPPFLPDYSSSAATIFIQTTIGSIRRAGSLLPLAGDLEAVLSRKRLQDIPSYVIDWSLPCLPTEIERVTSLYAYNASGSRKGSVRLQSSTQFLEVEAVNIDHVVTVGDVSRHSQINDTYAALRGWRSLIRSFEKTNDEYPSGGTYEGAFWRTLIADLIHTGTTPATRGSHGVYRRATADDFQALRAWIMWARCISRDSFSRTASFTQRDLEEGISAIDHTLKTATASRRFFLTSNGYMGMGPKTTMVGDQVFVFKGSKVPFMLRQDRSVIIEADSWTTLIEDDASDEQNSTLTAQLKTSFRLIGDCFAYGLMDGEAFEQANATTEKVYLV
ncbi:heterokaryon incompatibility -domain-containing [Pyrenophora seminiperda CCB06]|uniref:Heterokaryon incompatibility-domain-containing n=1 Tax=Pyrenophora seminiperda CCB06 TaxID=1302712 RepID=A0A3M7MAX8_9PLEO|nr:heterokaryon incompatibility -domain-containing [Pyrenophora seminiperda CCB06]